MKFSLKLFFLIQLLALALSASSGDAFRKERGRQEKPRSTGEQQMERVRYIMLPLLRVSSQRNNLAQVRLSIVDDSALNAASGGDGQYFVTTGLLNEASDNQLRAVLAHEIAHEELGHPMKAQVLGTGLELGAALLEKIVPGSGAVAPIAGTLIAGRYTRPMELAADRQAALLLQRAGYSKEIMTETLTWLMRRNGDTGGGIFASHPATSERIQALRSNR